MIHETVRISVLVLSRAGLSHTTLRNPGTVNVRQAIAKTAGPVVGARSDSLPEVVTERVEVSRTHDGHDIAPCPDVRESVGHVAFTRLGPRA